MIVLLVLKTFSIYRNFIPRIKFFLSSNKKNKKHFYKCYIITKDVMYVLIQNLNHENYNIIKQNLFDFKNSGKQLIIIPRKKLKNPDHFLIK